FLEAQLVVFLHAAQLILHLQDLEVQLLDRARQLPHLLLELGDARIGRLRRGMPGRSERHRQGDEAAEQGSQKHGYPTRVCGTLTAIAAAVAPPRLLPFSAQPGAVKLCWRATIRPRRPCDRLVLLFAAAAARQLPAPRGTVAARRSCDQQEMSSQPATGR